MDVDASNSLVGVYVTPVLSGKLYAISGYAKAASGTPTMAVGSNTLATTVALTTSYAAFSVTSRMNNTAFWIARVSAASNSIYIDSVTLQAAEILGTTGIPRGQGPGVDYAGQFNGTSQSLSITDTDFNPGTGDFTLGTSFYLDKLSAIASPLISAGTFGGDYFWVYITDTGQVKVQFNDSTTDFTHVGATGQVQVGNWYTLIVQFDRDGNVTFILNNATAVNLGSIAGNSTSVDPGTFFIGKYSGGTYYFPGRINGAFYLNRLTTDAENTYLFNTGKWRKFSELGITGTNGSALTSTVIKGFYDMDTAGALGADSTINGNTLTNNGTVTQGTGNSQYSGGASFTFDQPGTLDLGSSTVNILDGTLDVDDAGTITPGSSTIELGGISNLSGSTTQSLHDVKILTGAVVSQRSATTLDGTFTDSGSYVVSAGTLSVGGSLYLPGTFTHGNGTLLLTGAGSETLKTGGNNLTALTLSGSGLYNLSDTLTVTSALNLSGSTLDLNGQTLVVTGASFNNDGTLRLEGNETLTGFTNDGDSGIVYYDGTSGPYTLKDWSYYGLTLNGAATTFTLPTALDVQGALTILAGTLDADGHAATAGGLVTLSGGTYVASTATQTFDGGLTVSGGTFTGATGDVNVDGDVLLSSGTFTAPTGTFTVSGDWTRGAAIFTPGTGTVTLDGGSQTLSGSTTFRNLTKIVTSAQTLSFAAGTAQTIGGILILNGAPGNLLSLASTVPGTRWQIDPQGGRSLSDLNVRDSDNINVTAIDCHDHNCTDSGNNIGWTFVASLSTSSSEETQAAGGGGARGSSAQMAARIAQARTTILARFEGKRQASERLVAQDDQVANEEVTAREREDRIAQRVAAREAEMARIEKTKKEIETKFALHREERYARALALEERHLAENQAALLKEQEELAQEQETNRKHREDRLAEGEWRTEQQLLAANEEEEREERAAQEREVRIAQRITEHEAAVAQSEKDQEELQKKYALHREERYARALAFEEQRLTERQTALEAERQALEEEQQKNAERRKEQLAKRSAQENLKRATSPLAVTAARRGKLYAVVGDTPVIFADVSLDEWYAPYVSYVVEEKIATGYEDETGKPKGEFGVTNPVTYAEVLKMAMQASDEAFDLRGLPPPRNKSAQGTWAAAYVAKAEALQLSVFAPSLDTNRPATRGAVIQTILETVGIPTGAKAKSSFSDLSNDHPYAPAIVVATTYGLVSGDMDASGNPLNTFRPDEPINRAEVAKIIALVKELLE
ncbi:MAG: S-layer homology domain-containing protein [Candidatus Peribacteraceae bacterium]|nr:S-layer homology domain-containing protein [Candidatus Peribacteraceae bacterium]